MNQGNAIQFRYVGPTDLKGAVLRFETYDLKENRLTSIEISWDTITDLHPRASALDVGLDYLKACGFKPYSFNGRNPKHYTILVEWDFELLTKLFKGVE